MAAPVFEVVAGLLPGAGEVGDFVLVEAVGGEEVAGLLIPVGGLVFAGKGRSAVAGAVGEDFPAEVRVLIYFEEVDAGVGDVGG